MGLKFKVDGVEQPISGTSGYIDGRDEPAEIPMTEEMTKRLWEVINENTELKQQLYMVENKLEQIKRLVAE